MTLYTLTEHRRATHALDAKRFASVAEATAYAAAHRLEAHGWRPATGASLLAKPTHGAKHPAQRLDPNGVYLATAFGELYEARLSHLEQS